MKIVLAEEMRSADQAVFSRIAVPSRAVMETAGRAAAALVLEQFSEALDQGVLVLAGPGNNGGDGFVAARTLLDCGVYVEAACVKRVAELQGDARDNAVSFLNSGGRITEMRAENWHEQEALRSLANFGVVLDALTGTGFRGRLEGFLGALVEYVNAQAEIGGAIVVSVDIPSGVETDTGQVYGPAVAANATLALQCLKPAHVFYPGAGYCGETYIAQIGISPDLAELSRVRRELITEERAAGMLQKYITPEPEEHKGKRGHVLVVGGGAAHYGAPRMSAEAALVCGAGLVTLAVPRFAADTLALTVRELMCVGLDSDQQGDFSGSDHERLAAVIEGKKALVIGPGMGRGPGSAAVLENSLRRARQSAIPVVVDADGLTIIAEKEGVRGLLTETAILTPHPGEASRLLGIGTEQVQSSRLAAAAELSSRFKCWVVLKGARTVIAGPDGSLAVNPAAVPSLATAGSGDVLAGAIGALLARGLPAQDAAACAVFAHGCAGELGFVDNLGPIGTLAGDILGFFPPVLNALLRFARPAPKLLRKVLPGSMHQLAQEVVGSNE